MSLRSALLPVLDAVDQIQGPDGLDFQVTRCRIITRKWSRGRRGDGTPQETSLELPPWTPIGYLTGSTIGSGATPFVAGSGGRYESGEINVGPIRPFFRKPDGTTGGFTAEQLDPVKGPGIEIVYRLYKAYPTETGIAGDFTLVQLRREDPLEFYLVLSRELVTP